MKSRTIIVLTVRTSGEKIHTGLHTCAKFSTLALFSLVRYSAPSYGDI